MSIKGTAGKSASGASMSKYDVEVEGRLKALEEKLDTLIELLNSNDYVTGSCAKDSDGVRRIHL
jgi:hypothetical protein